MPRQLDLRLNFPLQGLENLDAANAKLNQLAATLDGVQAKINAAGRGVAASSAQEARTVQVDTEKMAGFLAGYLGEAIKAEQQQTRVAQEEAQKRVRIAEREAAQRKRAIEKALGPQDPERAAGGGRGGVNAHHASIYTAYNPAMYLASTLGIGAAGYVGYSIFRDIARDIAQMVRETTQGARQLQNFATSFGITTREAQKFQAAAEETGVQTTTLTTAMGHLAEAMEDPAGVGRKTTAALRELGVQTIDLTGQLRAPGEVALQLVQRLSEVGDAARRDALATEVFGRGFRQLIPLINEWKNIGTSGVTDIFPQTQEELVRMNSDLVKMKENWQEIERQLVAGLLPVVEHIASVFDAWRVPTETRKLITDSAIVQNIPVHPETFGIHMMADAATIAAKRLESSSVSLLQSHIAQLQKQSGQDFNKALQFYNQGNVGYGKHYEALAKREQEEIQPLKARLKALQDEQLHANQLATALQELKARVQSIADSQLTPVQRVDRMQQEFLIKHPGLHIGLTGAGADAMVYFGELREEAEREAGKKAAEKTAKSTLSLSEQRARIDAMVRQNFLTTGTGTLDYAIRSGFDDAGFWRGPNVMPPMSAQQLGSLGQMLTVGREHIRTMLASPEGQSAAAENLATSWSSIYANAKSVVQEIKETETGLKAAEDKDKERFAIAKQGVEAIIQYERDLADVRKQQEQQTRTFFTGLFDASISQQPSAGWNFLRGQGRKIADHIVGNAAVGMFGTLNEHATFQRDLSRGGILGYPVTDANGVKRFQPNFLGTLLAGTPFGVDQSKDPNAPLKDATSKNTDATIGNTALLRDLTETMGKIFGVDTRSMPGMSLASAASAQDAPVTHSTFLKTIDSVVRPAVSTVSGITGALRGANPLAAIQASLNAVAAFGSGVDRSGRATMLPQTVAAGSTNPELPFAFPRVAYPLNIGRAPQYAADGLPLQLPTIPNLSLPGSPATGYGSFGPVNTGYSHANDQTISGAVQNISGTMSKLGKVFGSMGSGTGGGFNPITGQVHGPGYADNLSGLSRVGATLGMAGAVGGGTLAAYKGFSQGGARGDIAGAAGVMEAIAPFTGPAAPFLEAGGAIAGLISSLFPDPRQQRIRQEAGTVAGDRFIAPAARAYNYSGDEGGSGFSLGMGSSIRSGGPNAQYSITLQAMDAQSFLEFSQRNSSEFATAMLYATQSGASSALLSELAYQNSVRGPFSSQITIG